MKTGEDQATWGVGRAGAAVAPRSLDAAQLIASPEKLRERRLCSGHEGQDHHQCLFPAMSSRILAPRA